MSTELKKIKGRYEKSHNGDCTVNYEKNVLYLTRFAGGKKNGAMLQLTISQEGYIQLTQKQVKNLIKILEEAFDYEKNPSD